MFYTVQQGDSPALIAKKLTGTPALAAQLIAANPKVPRAVRGGLVTFQSLFVGQKLNLPPSWGIYSGGALGDRIGVGDTFECGMSCTTDANGKIVCTPIYCHRGAFTQPLAAKTGGMLRGAFGVGDANSIAVELAAINAQANTAPQPDADGSYHGAVLAYQTAGQVAVTAGGLGPDIDATYGKFSGYNNQLTSAAWASNGSLQAVNSGDASSSTPAQLSDAQSAQAVLGQMASYYQQANAAGQAAANAENQSPPPPNLPAPPVPGSGSTAADALFQYMQANGCDCSAQLQSLTKTFQTSAGITADGYYGVNTQSALQTALTTEWNASGNAGPASQAPAACYTTSGGKQTGACSPTPKPAPPTAKPCPAGQVNDVDTGACVPACPAGQAPINGVCTPVSTPTTGGGVVTAGNGPLVAGVLLVMLGAGAVTYAVKHPKHAKVHHRSR
ncbi:MAG TPA: LysM domain-containing protein [Polyangiaceae bacterium]|nr:LysM domain-containing protein [Polyangiaceae bacterium]